MTVKELINELKKIREKDAEVYLVKDWEQFDENGYQTDLYRIEGVCDQLVICPNGFDFDEVREVLLCASEECATYKIDNSL